MAYIGETDSLAHLGGKKPLKSLLRSFDGTIEELISDSDGRLEVEMFSDHGNNYADYTSVKLNDAINAAGFKTEKSLRRLKALSCRNTGWSAPRRFSPVPKTARGWPKSARRRGALISPFTNQGETSSN